MINRSTSSIFAMLAGLALTGACATTSSEPVAVAAAQPAAPDEQAGTGDDGLDPDEMICKKRTVTGSRIARSETCMTRAQWRRQSANANRSIENMKNNRQSIPAPDEPF